jgi:hypothetical protein
MTSETQSDWLVELSHMQRHVGLICWTNYPIVNKLLGTIPQSGGFNTRDYYGVTTK